MGYSDARPDKKIIVLNHCLNQQVKSLTWQSRLENKNITFRRPAFRETSVPRHHEGTIAAPLKHFKCIVSINIYVYFKNK